MKKLLLTLSLALPAALSAQTTHDEGLSFGARASVEASVKLAPGLHLSAHEESRCYTGGDDILRFYTGADLTWKVLPFLKLGAGYELINRYRYDDDAEANAWSIRHRGNFFASGTFRVSDWQFGLKETLRLTHRPDDFNSWQAPRNALALKSRFSVKYRGWDRVVPFGEFELRTALNDAAYSATYNASSTGTADRYTGERFLGYTHAYVNRYRLQLGVTLKIDRNNKLDFYLLGDHYRDKAVDTNREGSESWTENGLVLKSIDWYTGNRITAGISYSLSF